MRSYIGYCNSWIITEVENYQLKPEILIPLVRQQLADSLNFPSHLFKQLLTDQRLIALYTPWACVVADGKTRFVGQSTTWRFVEITVAVTSYQRHEIRSLLSSLHSGQLRHEHCAVLDIVHAIHIGIQKRNHCINVIRNMSQWTEKKNLGGYSSAYIKDDRWKRQRVSKLSSRNGKTSRRRGRKRK